MSCYLARCLESCIHFRSQSSKTPSTKSGRRDLAGWVKGLRSQGFTESFQLRNSGLELSLTKGEHDMFLLFLSVEGG